jgi:hypothetical protein
MNLIVPFEVAVCVFSILRLNSFKQLWLFYLPPDVVTIFPTFLDGSYSSHDFLLRLLFLLFLSLSFFTTKRSYNLLNFVALKEWCLLGCYAVWLL